MKLLPRLAPWASALCHEVGIDSEFGGHVFLDIFSRFSMIDFSKKNQTFCNDYSNEFVFFIY